MHKFSRLYQTILREGLELSLVFEGQQEWTEPGLSYWTSDFFVVVDTATSDVLGHVAIDAAGNLEFPRFGEERYISCREEIFSIPDYWPTCKEEVDEFRAAFGL